MTPVAIEDSVYLHFGTSSVTTGAATDADSTPTVTVAEDGTDMGLTPTVTNVAVGLYKVQIDVTAANGFESGRRYSCYAVATVGAITGRDGIGEFEVLGVDLNTGIASVTGAVGSVTGAVGSVTGLTASNLDATITSRMATYTQPTGFLAATFPGGTIANTTNITAGTITTVTTTTNLTNLPATAALEATLTTMKGATFVEGTDSLEALRDRGDAAWITATGFATPTNITAATGIVLSGVTHTGAVIPTVSAVTGLTASDVGAIKLQTDKLAFTVANQVDANLQSVNDITVLGTGAAGNRWRP